MDGRAIQYASDEQLKQLGLALGDILAIRSYCRCKLSSTVSESMARKESLYVKLFGKKATIPPRKIKNTCNPSGNVNKTVKVSLGWQNYEIDVGRYKQIRLAKGGGIREFSLSLSSTYDEILTLAISTFFIGCSIENMTFKLGNFKGEEIVDQEIPTFTLQNYRDLYNLPRLNVYLLSKDKSKYED